MPGLKRIKYDVRTRSGRIIQKTARQLPRVTVYQDSINMWRWSRTATNGNITSTGAQGFTRRFDAIKAAEENLQGPYLLQVIDKNDAVVKSEVTKTITTGLVVP